MSNKKILSEVVKLIFVQYENDGNNLRALRRINMAQINMARKMLPEEAKLLGRLKPFFKNKREVAK